jgi:hypothetical protein
MTIFGGERLGIAYRQARNHRLRRDDSAERAAAAGHETADHHRIRGVVIGQFMGRSSWAKSSWAKSSWAMISFYAVCQGAIAEPSPAPHSPAEAVSLMSCSAVIIVL